jgi:hypothetical protein
MGLKFYKQFFTTKTEVLADIEKNDIWPTTFVSGGMARLSRTLF